MQALKQMYVFFREDPHLKKFIATIENTIQKLPPQITPQQFSTSQHRQKLWRELNELNLDKLKPIMGRLPQVPHITAYILKACKQFTIAFLIIPPKTIFDWHDHCQMNGISRCVYGSLKIRSLDPAHLTSSSNQEKIQQIQIGDILNYPIEKIREEKLDSSDEKNRISSIYPDTYNIHQICSFDNNQSAFIDLLMPEYPVDSCHFYETIESGEEQKTIKLRMIKEGKQKVIGFDSLVKLMRERQVKGI